MPLVRRQIILAFLGSVGLCGTLIYFSHYPLVGLTQRIYEFFLVFCFLMLAAGLGTKILSVGTPVTYSVEMFVFSVAVGVPAISFILLGLALSGEFHVKIILTLTLLGGVLIRGPIVDWVSWILRKPFALKSWKPTPFDLVLLGLGSITLCVTLLCALAPPTYYDSLVYHLALPAKYLQEGRMAFVPFNHYSHFPQNMEMIYGWFLAMGSDVAAQLFTLALTVLTGLTLIKTGRSVFAFHGNRWDLLLFISAPCVLLLSSETYVEVPMAFWTLLSLTAFIKHRETHLRRWLILAGLMAGYTAGIKYTGVITPGILTLLAFMGPRSRSGKDRVMDVLALGGPAFLMILPWLAKNVVFTGGNPVFPFLPSFFPAQNVHLPVESAQSYFRVFNEYGGSSSLLHQLLEIPLRLLSNTVSFGGGIRRDR